MTDRIREKEQIIESGILTVRVLPVLGGKITSVYYEKADFELVAQNRREYRIPSPDARFDQADASGIDDAFPAILPCTFRQGETRIRYTDHGEIWRKPLEVTDISRSGIWMQYASDEYPYVYHKTVSVAENKVILQYKIENSGDIPFPCIWTLHGLMRYEEDMEIFYPCKARAFENAQTDQILGKEGKVYSVRNDKYDFSRVLKRDSLGTVKYYVQGKTDRGCCGFLYPSQQVKCTLSYNEKILPYLGVWITAGGFRGDYNCALEPSNGYYDSVEKAASNGSLYYLVPGRPLKFKIELEISEAITR